MNKDMKINLNKRIYGIISFLLFIISVVILAIIDKTNNIKISFVIQILLILYLSKIVYGCIIHVKELYQKQKYSYSIIMNLGLVLFLVINILRQTNLLINNWNETSINDIYNNTLNSFSFFILLILPIIIVLAGYSIITNIILIKKEGFRFQNLLGIFFGIIVIFGSFASQYIYSLLENIELLKEQLLIKRLVDISLNSVLCYFYCITLATLYCNIMAARHNPDYDKDFVIVLGAKIRKDGTLTPLLKARVDRAIKFGKEQKESTGKNIIYIPSGGQGADEVTSEAEAMSKYLQENGVSKENIVIENKSVNTEQNMRYSKDKIDGINKEGKIIFSTTNYHVFRSGVIANNEGIDCEGIGSPTKWYFYVNAIIREFIANLFYQRKQHLILITSINVVMFILVFIGYYYKL